MCYFFKIAVTVMIAIHLTTGGCVQTHVFEKALKSMDAPQGDPIDPSGWYDASYAWRDDSPTHWEYKNEPRFFQYEPFFEATYDSSTSDNGPKSNSDRHRFWHHHDALPNKKSNHWYYSHGKSFNKPPQNVPKDHPYLDHHSFAKFKIFPEIKENQLNKDHFHGTLLSDIVDEHYQPIKIPSSPVKNPIQNNPVKTSMSSTTQFLFFPEINENQSEKENFQESLLSEMVDEHYQPIKIPSSPEKNPIQINPVTSKSTTKFHFFPEINEIQSNKGQFHGTLLSEIVDEHYQPVKIPSSPENNYIQINQVKKSMSSSTKFNFVEQYYILPTTSTVKSPTLPPITPPKKRPTIGSQERTTRSPVQIAQCVRSCPVTSEFNPVCGSNNITYANPGRLECAQFCGIDVQLKSKSSCSAIIPRPTLMPTPAPMKPTRRTTINTPSPTGNFLDTTTTTTTSPPVTISQDILNSIFTSSTPDDNYDIDIRTRAKLFPPQYVYPVPVQKKRG